MPKSSSLEALFDARWDQLTRDLDLPVPTGQVYFHETLDHRFDRAWIDKLIAIDLQGGQFTNGGHNRGRGMENDCIKYNAAVALGWRVFLATTSMIEEDPDGFIQPIITLLQRPVLTVDTDLSMWTARLRNLNHNGDSVCNNGIYVERLGGTHFGVRYMNDSYDFGGGKIPIAEIRQEILSLILSVGA